jgi:hypothetical protein
VQVPVEERGPVVKRQVVFAVVGPDRTWISAGMPLWQFEAIETLCDSEHPPHPSVLALGVTIAGPGRSCDQRPLGPGSLIRSDLCGAHRSREVER